ncbi:MAG: metal-sensing transcriptional repressor [Chloroflexota bacterium]
MSPTVVADDRARAVRHAQRASGQVGALAGMVAAGDPFPAIAQQIQAARGSLESLLVRLVELELDGCLPTREVREEVDGLLRTAFGHTPARRSPSRPAAIRSQGSLAASRQARSHEEGTD